MTTYKIRVTTPFTDRDTKKLLSIGDKLETDSYSRASFIVQQRLGDLVEIKHGEKKGKRIYIHHLDCLKIGGIETAHRQIAKVFADYDITFVFQKADPTQVLELGKTCSVIVDDGIQRYESDVFILSNYDGAPAILRRVKAKKVYQFIHTDWEALTKLWRGFSWKPDKRIDQFVSVSETAQKGLKNAFGIDSVVCHNVLAPLDKQRRLVFVVLSRATQEKGIDRIMDFVDLLEAAGKDFVVLLCSPIEQTPARIQARIKASSRILVIPPSLYSQELLRCADYGLMLSRLESFCYAVHEMLQRQIPVIVSKIPAFEEVVQDGKNGYILEDDFSNLDIEKIFNKIPKVKPYIEEVDPTWFKVLKGEL